MRAGRRGAIAQAIQGELTRERRSIELIASENFTSPAVLEAVGSVLTNKYAEGYPAHRYYGGCEQVDVVEDLARERACRLFGCKQAIQGELTRERRSIELIASENFTSPAVLEAVGSVLTNKYAEGYPAHRYYGGCEQVDVVEDLARERACRLFGCKHANVQPHCGANANLAAYAALVKPGDTILGMSLDHGGHLTHGSPVNFSGKLYNFVRPSHPRQPGELLGQAVQLRSLRPVSRD